jgi:hypothetical protein
MRDVATPAAVICRRCGCSGAARPAAAFTMLVQERLVEAGQVLDSTAMGASRRKGLLICFSPEALHPCKGFRVLPARGVLLALFP